MQQSKWIESKKVYSFKKIACLKLSFYKFPYIL